MKKAIIILAALLTVGCSTASQNQLSWKNIALDAADVIVGAIDPTGVASGATFVVTEIAKD